MPSKLEKSKLRIIKVLNDLLNGIEPKRHYCCTPVKIPISFIEESNKYKRHLIDKGQRDRTVESKLFRIKIFFTYLEKQSISLQAINYGEIDYTHMNEEKFLGVDITALELNMKFGTKYRISINAINKDKLMDFIDYH